MKGRKLYALRMDSEMLKEEANMEEGVDGEWLEGWGRRRLDTARRRKRDKTTGEKKNGLQFDWVWLGIGAGMGDKVSAVTSLTLMMP